MISAATLTESAEISPTPIVVATAQPDTLADGTIATDDNSDAQAADAQANGIPLPPKDTSFPLWAIIIICILGGGALTVGIYFLVRFLKNRPKPPKGGGDRKIEL